MKIQYTCLFLLYVLFSSCAEVKEEIKEESIRPVRYGKVIRSGSTTTNTFSGTSQSSKEAKLSFRVSGTVNRLNVKIGDKVSKGQLIASVEAVDYGIERDKAVAQLKNSETQIKSAETQRVVLKSTYERVETLYENNSVPLSEYEEAKAAYEAVISQYEAAQAQVAAAKKQVEAANNQVSYARLTAPFSGIITAVDVEENEMVGSGSTVAVLSFEGKPEVRVGIPESFISNIRKGQEVKIGFSTINGQALKGIVSEVAFSSSDASTYPVIISIVDPKSEIRPGMAANVTFSSQLDDNDIQRLIAPVKSIGEGPNGHFAFLLLDNNEKYIAKKTQITIGALLPNGFEIKEGLEEGSLVATAGLQSLLDGMTVKLLKE